MTVRIPADEQDFQNLLESLRNNDPSVTRVYVAWDWDGMVVGYGGALGHALAENTMVSSIGLHAAHLLAPSEVTIWSADPLILFLRNSASLTRVTLTTMNWRSRGASLYQDLEYTILNALAINASVEILRLVHIPCPISMPTAHSFHGLTNCLDSTTTLSHLWLSDFTFRGDDSNEVILALSKSPVTRLKLVDCKFDAATTDSFVKLVQGTGERSSRARALCDLSLITVTFDDRPSGQVLAMCLVGSPLRELCWEHFGQRSDPEVGAFFDSLATTPSQISLHTLSLPRLNARDAESMARFLPLSTSLRVVRICDRNMDDAVNRHQLLSAVRQNGSLVEVSGLGDAIKPFLTRNDFFQNAGLRDMLAKEEGLHCLPTFFKAAQDAPRTAPNVILIGLMAAAEDVIGPKFDKKGQLAVTNRVPV
jgi:hypothetical protein